MSFEIVQMLYWLSLSAWFGLVLFAAMAAPVIFRVVEEADPTLPTVLSVNLDGQHGTLLSMTLVNQILSRLVWVQLVCAGGMLLAIVLQWVMLGASGQQTVVMNTLRSVLFLASVGLLIYAWRSVWSRVDEQRKHYVDNAENPEIALPARDRLMKLYREGEFIQLALATLLSALIVFSVGIQRPSTILYTS